MTNGQKASGINPPNLTQNEQGIEKIIARKKGASIIHEIEQQSQKEARANAEETRKRCLEKFAETSRVTAETNNEKDTKKEKRTRQSGSETLNYLREKAENNLESKKEENNIKQMQEELLRISSENQLQLFGQVINYQRKQMQKVADSLQCMQQQQDQLIVVQLQAQQQSQQICKGRLEKLKRKIIEKKTLFSYL